MDPFDGGARRRAAGRRLPGAQRHPATGAGGVQQPGDHDPADVGQDEHRGGDGKAQLQSPGGAGDRRALIALSHCSGSLPGDQRRETCARIPLTGRKRARQHPVNPSETAPNRHPAPLEAYTAPI